MDRQLMTGSSARWILASLSLSMLLSSIGTSIANVSLPTLAPRLKLSDLAGRSFMVHAAKDNYGDQPGGGRAYCGIIK